MTARNRLSIFWNGVEPGTSMGGRAGFIHQSAYTLKLPRAVQGATADILVWSVMAKIKSLYVLGVPPFSDFTVRDLPSTAKLVVLLGPNGSGKTSLLNAFTHPQSAPFAGKRSGVVTRMVEIECHDQSPHSPINLYMRSAYRTEHRVDVNAGLLVIPHAPPSLTRSLPAVGTLDPRVTHNLTRLLHFAHRTSVSTPNTWEQAVAASLAPVNDRLKRIFPYLQIAPIKYPTGGNQGNTLESLCFEKYGARYRYEGLSAGEKEAFDLLFDMETWAKSYPDAVYCIDEPELHLHSALQADLLEQLVSLLPEKGQLWIATHSIGIARKAVELHRLKPDEIVFLNCGDTALTSPQTLRPASANRTFWKQLLSVTLHDMADLVAPTDIIICEGKPLGTGGKQKNAAFDAKVYNIVFEASHPDVSFVSSGNSSDVTNDSIKLRAALNTLVPGMTIKTLIDRDNNSEAQMKAIRTKGNKILSSGVSLSHRYHAGMRLRTSEYFH
jgi:predicted ATPase